MVGFSSKRVAVIIAIVVGSMAVEVYAHTYVPIHGLPVVTEEAVHRFLDWQNPTGGYTVSQSGCRWFIGWIIRRPIPRFGYIYIFKVEQNGSLLVLQKDLHILELTSTSNNTGNFVATVDEISYAGNYTSIRIDYDFGEIGTYQVSLSLRVNVYERTLVGLIPKEEVTIPINALINYRP